MSEESTPTVTLLGEEWTPRAPADYALVQDLAMFVAKNPDRARAAALVATWAGKKRPRVSYEGCGFSPGAFGGACIVALTEAGASYLDIQKAGIVALQVLQIEFISKQDMEGAVGFSEPGEASSSAG